MFSKPGAIWPAPLKGGVNLDSIDARYIECRCALLKLNEIVRVVNLLKKSAVKAPPGKTIIPLMNFVLALCQGPTFNVSPVLKKRLQLLSQFKLIKLTEVPIVNLTAPLELANELLPVETDMAIFKEKLYDSELQSKILDSLSQITKNCIGIYGKKIRYVLTQRDKFRHEDVSERAITSEESPIGEFLQPTEITLGLEFAALVSNRNFDSTERSLQKLTIQVLGKFAAYLKEKEYPRIDQYTLELKRFSRTKPGYYSEAMARLPYWGHSMHRMFAMLLRIKYLMDITQAILRQAFLPNKDYFNDNITLMFCENLYQFRLMTDALEDACSDDTIFSNNVTEMLTKYHYITEQIKVQFSSVIDTYKKQVQSTVNEMKIIMKLVEEFHSRWKNLHDKDNSKDYSKLCDLSPKELAKKVNEKYEKDKLTFESVMADRIRKKAIVTDLIYKPDEYDDESSDSDSDSEDDDSHREEYAECCSPHLPCGRSIMDLFNQSPKHLIKNGYYALQSPTAPDMVAKLSAQLVPKTPREYDPEEAISPRWIFEDKNYCRSRTLSPPLSAKIPSSPECGRRRSNSAQACRPQAKSAQAAKRSHSLQSAPSPDNKNHPRSPIRMTDTKYASKSAQLKRYKNTSPHIIRLKRPKTAATEKQSCSSFAKYHRDPISARGQVSLDEALIGSASTDSSFNDGSISTKSPEVLKSAMSGRSCKSASSSKSRCTLKKVRFVGVPPPTPEDVKCKGSPSFHHVSATTQPTKLKASAILNEGYRFCHNLREKGATKRVTVRPKKDTNAVSASTENDSESVISAGHFTAKLMSKLIG
ncbi:HEL061Wp [Eremothecium sinecaudum]|uniref:HEL061Wp n=1 Tax=Eremothecium sinecaudum TaxID=45286 RepID=A0A0X8HTM1_9SACH|nr:HEL061Wp [Eremothecium sinecaudum]AMD21219.1 HEL061Wp [Eremothecium sinecaudum]